MNLDKFKAMTAEIVISPMLDYMNSLLEDDGECDYSKEHIERCGSLLLNYLDSLAALIHPTDAAIMEQVEAVVLALNELNEETGCCLIETGEREALWEVIQTAAVECGLSSDCLEENEGDITCAWREW